MLATAGLAIDIALVIAFSLELSISNCDPYAKMQMKKNSFK